MPDFGFCGPTYVAKSIYQGDEEAINLFIERLQTRRPDGRGEFALYQVPGKVTLLTFPDLAEVRGLNVFSGSTQLLAVCGSSVYSVSTGFAISKIGTLATSSGPVSIADNGSYAMIADGTARYAYNPAVPYFTSMTSPAFTATISATTMTVTNVSSGVIGPFQSFTGSGVTSGSTITAGTPLGPGQTGNLTISPSQTVASPTAMTAIDGAFTASSYVAEVDGFFIFANPGTQQWGASSYGSPVSPNVPPSIGFKDGAPDNLVCMIVNNREVFLLGERTSEVWIDTGAFPFPFQRLPGSSTQHGCVAPFSVSRLGESFAWLSRDTRGQGFVYAMRGYVPERISTHAVEYALSTYSVISDARAYTYQQGGHEFYVLSFPSADATWVFDAATALWHKRAYRDSLNVLHRDRGNCAAIFSNKIVVGDWQNGNLYSLDQSVYTDAGGVPIYRLRRAPHLTADLKRMRHMQLQIQFEPGVGLPTGQGSNPQAMAQWSDDGGSTWSTEQWTSIGTIGSYKNRAIWRRLGIARDRVYQVVVTDPIKAAIISAELRAQAQEF